MDLNNELNQEENIKERLLSVYIALDYQMDQHEYATGGLDDDDNSWVKNCLALSKECEPFLDKEDFDEEEIRYMEILIEQIENTIGFDSSYINSFS